MYPQPQFSTHLYAIFQAWIHSYWDAWCSNSICGLADGRVEAVELAAIPQLRKVFLVLSGDSRPTVHKHQLTDDRPHPHIVISDSRQTCHYYINMLHRAMLQMSNYTKSFLSLSVLVCVVSNTKKLEAAHHRWQRKILKISWKDMITNKTVRERTGQDTLESIIRDRRLRWFGHTYRTDSNRIARQVMDWTLPHFRRKRGRPRVSWTSTVKIWICWVWHGTKLWI